MGSNDGSIIATIITAHMATNDKAAPVHVCPGIRIHAMDMVHPPGMGMPPMVDMDEHHTKVTIVLAANNSAETQKKTRCETFAVAMT